MKEPRNQEAKEQEVYVGPRPFERSERGLFFGRDREISELLSLVISSRVVLCYAPSGAGKTSLINAGLEPRLEKEGFDVLPSTRVRGLIPAGIDQKKIVNVYMFNALLSLAGTSGTPSELAECTLKEHLSKSPHLTDEEGFPAPRILMFDQFEELLTSYPERWQEREGFFRQVNDALQEDPLLRVLFIMREDFLARVEPFTRLLRPFPQARFHLDLLGPEGARAAITGPLKETDRRFKEGVVNALIEELQKVRVETTQGEAVDVIGEYVEPVQLQVVCRNLWISLPPEVQEISQEHLKAYGDVNHALRDFYESCLAKAKADLGANESEVRQWFERQLITPAGTRGIVFRDAERTADLQNNIVEFLEDWHLIRGEWRAGSRWYELTHDRFIEPIQRANEHWRNQRLARRTRLALSLAIPLVLAILLFAGIFTAKNSLRSDIVSQAVAATINVVEANVQATSTAQAEQAQVAIEDVALSKSRQLAAQALLTSDPSLSLLLAVQANRFKDTAEARRSLHKILSTDAVTDGTFLQAFNPELISPRLVKRLEENTSYVQSVAFSPDGSRFISGSQDGKLILWDFASAKPMGDPLPAPSSSFMSLAFSPDGKFIAAGTTGMQLLLWDASNGQPIGTPISDHGDLVTCVAFSPDGKRLASGSADKTVRIWDVSQGQLQLVKVLSPPAEVWSVAWSPDGKTLAVAGAGSSIHLLDAESFKRTGVLQGDNGFVRTLAWSPDGRVLVSGSASEEGSLSYGDVTFWDPANGRIIERLLSRNNQPVRTVAFDPRGKVVAIGQDNGTITFVDAASKQLLGDPVKAHNHRVMSIAFSPDGQYMISGSIDTTIALWDLSTPTKSIAINSTGKLLATSQGGVINLWGLTGDQTSPLLSLYGHTDDVAALTFSPDGSFLASAGRDDTIIVWDSSTGKLLEALISSHSGITALAISPDGTILVAGGQDGLINFWDIDSQKDFTSFNVDGAVAKLFFADEDNALHIATTRGELITFDLQTFTPRNTETLLTIQGDGATRLAVSQDGQRLAFYQGTGSAPTLADDERAHGIEISLWVESFDPTVNPDDIDFVVVKATEGNSVDRKFEEFLGPIQQIPMRGAWHFFRLDVPWQEQADLFLSTVQDKGFQFYALDLEVKSDDGTLTFLSDAEQWMKYVEEKVDQKVILQTGGYYMNSFGSAGDWMKNWSLLIMQYPFEPDRNGSPVLPTGVENWKIWNYSEGRGQGSEYGVGGNDVYLDVYNGTPKEMWEWLAPPAFSVYDRISGKLIHPNLINQAGGLNDIAFSPDGSFVAAAGNTSVSLLNAETGEEISTLQPGRMKILSLGFVHDTKLAIGMDDGTVFLWNLDLLRSNAKADQTIGLACSRLTRNLTTVEWGQYIGDAPYQKACPDLP